MTDVTRLLSQIEQGDPNAADQLLPLVYDELRKLAAVRLANEKPGQTLQAKALVHAARRRTFAMFQEWFEIRLVDLVFDLANKPLVHEDA